MGIPVLEGLFIYPCGELPPDPLDITRHPHNTPDISKTLPKAAGDVRDGMSEGVREVAGGVG